MKLPNNLLKLLIILTIASVLYFSRQIFFYKYEPEYYENLYYHSQWNYPGSRRGISDGELYKFVGYQIIKGENPFNINYEAPPFGKSLYGLAEVLFGNPYVASILLYLSLIVVSFLIFNLVFRDSQISLLATFLLSTTPFVATQIKETMLDLPHTLLFMIHTLFWMKYLSSNKRPNLILAGIFLGLATGTKFGVYTPPIIIMGMIFLFFSQKKKFIDFIVYPASIFGGYVFSYFTYFIRHPNPFPWLRLHEKVIDFYIGPPGKIDYLNQWRGIFLNSYQGWWQTEGMTLGDWSLVLPIGVITVFLLLIFCLKKHHKILLYPVGLALIVLLMNSLIPFWPRYLMPIIPVFVLAISYIFKKIKIVILILAFLNLPFLANNVVPKGPEGDAQAIAHFVSTRAYRELYRSIDPETTKDIPEDFFIKTSEEFLSKLAVRKIEAKAEKIEEGKNKEQFNITIKYFTRYGELEHNYFLDFVRVHNQWKTRWEWDFWWPGFSPESKFAVEGETIPLLRIETQKGEVLAQRGKWKEVFIKPRVMFHWNEFLHDLADVTGEKTEYVDSWVRLVVPDHYSRFVGYLYPSLEDSGLKKAENIPGVTFESVDYLVIPKNAKDQNYSAKIIKQIYTERPELFTVCADVYLVDQNIGKIKLPFIRNCSKDVVLKM